MLSLLKVTCNHVYLAISIAAWTIIQSFVHIYGLMHIQWWRDCKIHGEPQNHYLTILFGKQVCNNTENNILEDEWSSWIIGLDSLVFGYFILDSMWIVTAVGLLSGACCLIKGIWALVFYAPWITTSITILFFDSYCAIFFALQLPSFGTFFDWFNIIGITTQISALQTIEDNPVILTEGAVAIVMTFMAARGGVVWLANLILLILIFKITIKQYKSKYVTRKKRKPKNSTVIRTNSQRIRDWHLFYDFTTKTATTNINNNKDYYAISSNSGIVEAVNHSMDKNYANKELILTVHTFTKRLSFADNAIADTTSIASIDEQLSHSSTHTNNWNYPQNYNGGDSAKR